MTNSTITSAEPIVYKNFAIRINSEMRFYTFIDEKRVTRGSLSAIKSYIDKSLQKKSEETPVEPIPAFIIEGYSETKLRDIKITKIYTKKARKNSYQSDETLIDYTYNNGDHDITCMGYRLRTNTVYPISAKEKLIASIALHKSINEQIEKLETDRRQMWSDRGTLKMDTADIQLMLEMPLE